MGPGSALTSFAWPGRQMKVWRNPWRLMLAVNVAVVIGVFLHKIALPPYVPYIHLLADYHFGFIKRALIGATVSLFTANLRLRREAPAAVRAGRGLAVLLQEFHAHARPFRHLWLSVRDYPSVGSGELNLLRAARDIALDRPGSDPPHPSPDVCADHHR